MRERARQIGGKLEIWSAAGTGTEIELTVIASIASVQIELFFVYSERK